MILLLSKLFSFRHISLCKRLLSFNWINHREKVAITCMWFQCIKYKYKLWKTCCAAAQEFSVKFVAIFCNISYGNSARKQWCWIKGRVGRKLSVAVNVQCKTLFIKKKFRLPCVDSWLLERWRKLASKQTSPLHVTKAWRNRKKQEKNSWNKLMDFCYCCHIYNI